MYIYLYACYGLHRENLEILSESPRMKIKNTCVTNAFGYVIPVQQEWLIGLRNTHNVSPPSPLCYGIVDLLLVGTDNDIVHW